LDFVAPVPPATILGTRGFRVPLRRQFAAHNERGLRPGFETNPILDMLADGRPVRLRRNGCNGVCAANSEWEYRQGAAQQRR
jgi:hypothetical protein